MSALPWHLLPDSASVGDEGQLLVGGCDLVELAAEFGTPLFVYDVEHLRSRCREAVSAFPDGVAYASKAFVSKAMDALAYAEGMHVDVASGGELAVALAAGVPADHIVVHGNNKSAAELRRAIELGVYSIVVDSFDELDRIEALVAEGLPVPKIMLRITPGVEAHTHEFISTGQLDSKFGFGVPNGVAEEAVARAIAMEAVELVGIHMHIGSQVFVAESFARAVEVVAPFFNALDLPELSIGGGLGVAYVEGETSEPITEWGAGVQQAVVDSGITARVTAEPGRAITAAAAVTLYEVGTIKHIPDVRTYVAVDGGMNDNPRPALYGSGYETFLPRSVEADRPEAVTLVGKHCESGDVLVRNAKLPADLVVGDIVATPVTGAYGHTMGSNYNKLARPAVVFVADGQATLVIRRETEDDLLRNDVFAP